jgi:hypothetical protein
MENLKDSSSNSSSGSIMSLEGIFVAHYLQSLDRLQSTWMDSSKDTIDRNKFNLQLEYLIRLIPDTKKQDKIREGYSVELEKFKAIEGEKLPDVKAAMSCVTDIITFICQAFDLTHEDIVGPATSRQYRDKIIEIPDMMEKTNGTKD